MRISRQAFRIMLFVVLGWVVTSSSSVAAQSLVADGAAIEELAKGFGFTEGPASDKDGNVYFSDIPKNSIHIWTTNGELKTFTKESGGTNGIYFDKDGYLVACEGGARRMTRNDLKGKITVIAETFEDKKFNSPNDLWLDPKGGIYLTDPRYGNRDGMEMGEFVFYISPDGKKVSKVIDDLVRPNGIIGTPDGKTLYVADNGGGKIYSYGIREDGTLSDKKEFAPEGSDGMTIDNKGNVYLTNGTVRVYDNKGKLIDDIKFPQGPANVCFGGPEEDVLFVTARTGFYSVKMKVHGVRYRASDVR